MSPMMTWLTLLSMGTAGLLFAFNIDTVLDYFKADQ